MRTKIFDIAFWWVFLSMYIIKTLFTLPSIFARALGFRGKTSHKICQWKKSLSNLFILWFKFFLGLNFIFLRFKLIIISLRASSPGRSGDWAKKGKRACNYVSGIWISASKKSMRKLIGGDDISNEVITSVRVFQFLFTFAFVSASRWLVEIWQLSRRGDTGKLEVEFKFQRRSCELSFLFPPSRQSATETLLPGYVIIAVLSRALCSRSRAPWVRKFCFL